MQISTPNIGAILVTVNFPENLEGPPGVTNMAQGGAHTVNGGLSMVQELQKRLGSSLSHTRGVLGEVMCVHALSYSQEVCS